MRKLATRTLSLLLAVFLLVGAVQPAFAATYRPGAQSGPSSSYASDRYYSNYKRVPITGDNRTDLVAIALSQLGYQEGAANGYFSGLVSGRNNYVEFSYNMGDLGLGYGGSDYPWCASFVSWCLYQSHCTDQNSWKDLGRYHVGDYKYIWKEISCSQWVRQLKGAGYYKYSQYEGGSYTPKYGDLVFFQNSGGVAHIGICLYVANGRIYTVEGNTSDSSGLEANGGGVYFKNYAIGTSYINGYGVLPYKSNSSVTKIDYSGNNPTPGLYVANASKSISYGSYTADLVDGILGETINDGAWYGIDTTTGSGSVVIDLCSRYQITGIKAHLYAGADDTAPTSLSVSASVDGTNYIKVGNLELGGDAPYWTQLSKDAVVGRYVKLDAVSDGNGYFSTTIQLDAGDYEYKIAEEDYFVAYPSNNATLSLEKRSEVTFTLSLYTGEITTTVVEMPVVVPTLTLKYPTLAFEDEILYNAYFTVDDASSIVEMGMITFSSRLADGTIDDAVDVIKGYYASGDSYIVGSTTYYSPVVSYSLGSYCETLAGQGNAFGAATAVYGYYAKAFFAK